MNRRKFLTRVVGTTAGIGLTGTGADAIRKLAQEGPAQFQNVSYEVKGFTCVTCATGLQVMLMQ